MPDTVKPRDSKFATGTRWRPIEKSHVYLDFRQELPAYDILMSFNFRKANNDPQDKKRIARQRSKHVANVLQAMDEEYKLYGADRVKGVPIELTSEEVKDVGTILGREYSAIRLVNHDFFEVEGYTAIIESPHLNYSEAFAGSGEFAAIMLVYSIRRASARSLILLDEPETSLHPGAQTQLMRFIARMCVVKHHQVILCTHSPAMVEELPDTARKLLDLDPTTGKVVQTATSATTSEAFSRIGAKFPKGTFVVEDELASAFIMAAARTKGVDFRKSIDVQPLPGGAESILQRFIPWQSQLKSSCTVVLDGDKRPADPPRPSSEVPDSDVLMELEKVGIKENHLVRNGGAGDSQEQIQKSARTALRWVNSHLYYLPSNLDPDALLLQLSQARYSESDTRDAKACWVQITRTELGKAADEPVTAEEILATQKRSLAQIPHDAPEFKEIVDILHV